MARAALRLGVRKLAAAAEVAVNTIIRLEKGEGVHPRNMEAIRRFLEAAGVEFIEQNGGGPGVRLATRKGGRKK